MKEKYFDFLMHSKASPSFRHETVSKDNHQRAHKLHILSHRTLRIDI